ncbi:flagellar filament capping protein FliD [Cohnella zeiphila]|uniref:Flagellar hook-associated protein 2 n=1 Tax=Cohnella zeiphila TaxID=2761120 RepID=A0A7X0SLK3_9BACL|nr:flagellar filament capping protein FliD [Cohnella zeiphila]MBB6732253.1 flagellar filament capping protein FliD [Cohnella zeiphila]
MVTRITGLNSGMDIDSIVTQLMTAEKIPLDKMKQNKQTLTWKSDAYRDINKQLATLNTTLNKLRYSSQWQTSSASSSDTSIATVTASTNSSASSHSLVVNSLATGAILKGSAVSKADVPLTATTPLASTTRITAGENDQLSVTLDGSTKTITLTANDPSDPSASYTPQQLADELQNQLNSSFGYKKVLVGLDGNNITMTPQGSADSLPQLTVGTYGSNSGLDALGFTSGQSFKINTASKLSDIAGQFNTPLSYGTFSVNGVSFTYGADDTLASIINQVNASSAGVRMSYDSVTDQFSVVSKTTGASSIVEIKDGSGNLASALGFGSSNTASGTDAEVVIDGTTSHRSSNSFTVDDISYTLVSADPSKTITVNSTQDTDAIFNSIKSFVDAYNTTMTLVKTRVNEAVDKNYPPLTDDQRKDMSDSDIQLWEAKAKVGVLHSDSILNSIASSLRNVTSASVSTVSTDFNALYKIGITTMSYSSGYDVTTASNLQIDETKLRAAIQKDPDSVIKLFSSQPSDSSNAKTGIAQQMYNQVNDAISQLVTKAGGLSSAQDAITSTLGKQLHDLENDIDDFQDKLNTKEDNYYKQFAAMEDAVGKGNSTLSWLQSTFG